jgi:hypothetical protein
LLVIVLDKNHYFNNILTFYMAIRQQGDQGLGDKGRRLATRKETIVMIFLAQRAKFVRGKMGDFGHPQPGRHPPET